MALQGATQIHLVIKLDDKRRSGNGAPDSPLSLSTLMQMSSGGSSLGVVTLKLLKVIFEHRAFELHSMSTTSFMRNTVSGSIAAA